MGPTPSGRTGTIWTGGEGILLKPIKVKGRARRLVLHQVWPRMDHTEVTEINAPVRANGY